MIVNADLHIHSRYSKGTSKFMNIENIIKYGKKKGLEIIGTGDCLHPIYLKEIKHHNNSNNLLLTTEIEDENRIHHLIFIPNISKVEELRELLKTYSKNIDGEGRPKVVLNGKELFKIIKEIEGLIGPAHAFTPYTSIYKSFNSIYDCYYEKPDFLELGLSADTEMANSIEELKDIPFLSNSDAHSFYPHRLGREFNRIEINNLGNFEHNFEEIKQVLKNKNYNDANNKDNKNKIIANYGLDPALGKYYLTACSRCYLRYNINDAKQLNYKCAECGGRIKKGVLDRSRELQNNNNNNNNNLPDRPPYHKIIPLSQIISLSINKNIGTKAVDSIWQQYIEAYGNEITVLININIEDLKKINEKVGKIIYLFRKNKIYIYPGGGGEYGKISILKPKIKWYGSKAESDNDQKFSSNKPKTTLDKWIKK
ncbi:PHP domain protein [Methanococcus aeolicus Nankai-3]|uniref:PHP domain protein n=1 Tax=Methanococcus aeolicus (strain ATCC BAA-1280 / DSM 17508 / OCM 812 / Nankai-3) TaxID=419665 RepID=A6UWM3_META3|nr:TIGR00375 family protein [Methanococcus aeolicus]ABR56895.1 PHP domain protein [Methanococcus aeolicus Nankai-3]